MIAVSTAEAEILRMVQPFRDADREQVPLADAGGRILAEDVISPYDFPHWHNSAMDGYALRFSDLNPERPELRITEQTAAAGSPITTALGQGECARIFTGGVLPIGADTIAIQEEVERVGGDRLILKTMPQRGEYVRSQGEYLRSGALLLAKGTKLEATALGGLAAANVGRVWVYRRARVAILSTGSELVGLGTDQPLQIGQIIDSNQYALAAVVSQVGMQPIRMGHVADDRLLLKTAIQTAIDHADVVISSGGVSVGDYDFVADLLQELGAEIDVRSVAIKPGKPLTVARFPQTQTLYFGVPGNPVSALVCFWRLIQGALNKLQGQPERAWYPTFFTATATADLHAQGRRETYLWGHLTYDRGQPLFTPTDNYSSGNLINIMGTNALAVLRVNQTYVMAGDAVTIMLIP